MSISCVHSNEIVAEFDEIVRILATLLFAPRAEEQTTEVSEIHLENSCEESEATRTEKSNLPKLRPVAVIRVEPVNGEFEWQGEILKKPFSDESKEDLEMTFPPMEIINDLLAKDPCTALQNTLVSDIQIELCSELSPILPPIVLYTEIR